MAKKIKLPLEMANGISVRTLEELKENWNLEKVVAYYHNGRLLAWLNDRYYTELAEQVQRLASVKETNELQKQLCNIFEMPFTEEETIDMGAVEEKNRRLAALRQITADDEILKNVDKVAFNQEELAKLLDEGESVIYLVNNKFSIPLTEKNKKYMGVGEVTAIISSKEPVDFDALGISFLNIKFDEKYLEVSDSEGLYLLGKKCFKEEKFKEAFNWFLKAAKLENADAMFELGYRCYNEGLGVTGNEAEAVRWIKSAAERGHDEAQLNLGLCYFEGCGVKKDEVEAVKWIKLAAMQKNVEAQIVLGNFYYNGMGVAEDKVEAAKWYKMAAEEGDAKAQIELGDCYSEGKGVTKNEAEAVKWYRKAAEQNNAEAQHRLGYCYIKGEGVTEDKLEGIKWFKMSANQGYGYALLSLGNCYFEGIGIPENKLEGIKWIEKAAEQGLDEAKNELGNCYYLIARDLNATESKGSNKKVVKWYRKAAKCGNAKAQCELGIMYESGKVVDKDVEAAKSLYREAANSGNAEAQYRLGEMHEKYNLSDDHEPFNGYVQWFEKAAEQEHAKAQQELGMEYSQYLTFFGSGVDDYNLFKIRNVSLEEALQLAEKWVLKAAANGEAYGLFRLAMDYQNGWHRGIPKNLSKAKELYRKAVELANYEDAKVMLESIGETTENRNNNDSGCFITTAVCSSLNKPDDCDELMTMRWYRDKIKSEDADMAELIKEYYRVAPGVVKKIDKESNASQIYRGLWENSISKIYRSLKQEKYRDATLRYIDMFENLCRKYDAPLSPDIRKRIQAVRQGN